MLGKIVTGEEDPTPLKIIPLGSLLINHLEKYGEKVCQIDGNIDKSETFSSVRQRSIRLALALQEENLKPDDVVLICSSNTLDSCIPVLATLFLSARVANSDPTLSSRTTNYLISLVKPKIIFVEFSSVNLIEESLKGLEISPKIIVIGQSNKYSRLIDLIHPYPEEESFKPKDTNVDGISTIFFSSGTTGLPKAICHSHKTIQYCLNSQGFNTKYNENNNTSTLHFTTFYWFSGIVMLFSSILGGRTRIFSSNTSGESILKLIEKYKITTTFMAPIFTYRLTSVENPERFDTSSLKIILTGGTALEPKQFLRVISMFKNPVQLLLGYGMTEIGGISSFNLKSSQLMKEKIGSSGKVISRTSVKIVDIDTEELLGPNQKGEIRVKSPSLMLGYYQADASSCFDNDGFLKTGDLGFFDEDECLYVVERFKEMFKYLSWHIVPTAIEAVLMEHPAIAEAVAFGIPKKEEGEVPAACVTLKQGLCTTVSHIDAFVTERVSDRERLRGGIFIVDNLPKTPSGKIIRSEVRKTILKTVQNQK